MSFAETATASTLSINWGGAKIMHNQSRYELHLVRDGSGYQKGLIKRINFWKSSKCGHCQSENLYCRVWTFFLDVFWKEMQYNFLNTERGGMSKAIWNPSENLSVLVPWPVSLYSLVTIGYLETRGLQQQILSQPEYLIFDWFLNTEDHLY